MAMDGTKEGTKMKEERERKERRKVDVYQDELPTRLSQDNIYIGVPRLGWG
jgi:hypothetical protein